MSFYGLREEGIFRQHSQDQSIVLCVIWTVDRNAKMAWDKDLEIDFFFFLTRVKKASKASGTGQQGK